MTPVVPTPDTSRSDDTSTASSSLVTACKRRITELEEELLSTKQRHAKVNARHVTTVLMGRCIRRLVSLTDRVDDLVSEADRRACLDGSEDSSPSEEQDRLYATYKELIRWQPTLRTLFNSQDEPHELSRIYKDLNKGADSARGDDAASLKPAVVHWLMSARPVPEPPFDPSSKDGRGFDHDVTGRLLCPVDYDWNDPTHRAGVQDCHADFTVTADSWPAFLYEDGKYDPADPTRGFLKNTLLVKAFKHIFTSPSSATKMDETDHQRPEKRRKRDSHRTRSHVASLLGMNAICPRAIAYIAVQLRFALSNCSSWCLLDGEFSYLEFYNNIVIFFENAGTPEDKKRKADLLSWWNQLVIGKKGGVVHRPQEREKMSVAMSLLQRGVVTTPQTCPSSNNGTD